MSLRGRRVIDALKQRIGNYITLPVPPFGNIKYWEKVYKQLSPDSVFEWGQLKANDLAIHESRLLQRGTQTLSGEPTQLITLDSLLDISPHDTNTTTVILGCGNSAVGEELVRTHGWKGNLLQIDYITKVVDEMTIKCKDLPNIDIILDDAIELSSLESRTIDAVFDKGLIDTIFCANEQDQITQIMNSVHRVLQPGGMFCLMSLSQPEYIMPSLDKVDLRLNKPLWSNIEARECSKRAIMYRFKKAPDESSKLKLGGLKKGYKHPR